jgi:hypothetical protein
VSWSGQVKTGKEVSMKVEAFIKDLKNQLCNEDITDEHIDMVLKKVENLLQEHTIISMRRQGRDALPDKQYRVRYKIRNEKNLPESRYEIIDSSSAKEAKKAIGNKYIGCRVTSVWLIK